MYVYVANSHAVAVNQTGLTSNFFDQSLTVAQAYNFKCRLPKLNQLKAESRGALIRIIKQRGGPCDRKQPIKMQVRILIYLSVFNPLICFVIFKVSKEVTKCKSTFFSVFKEVATLRFEKQVFLHNRTRHKQDCRT